MNNPPGSSLSRGVVAAGVALVLSGCATLFPEPTIQKAEDVSAVKGELNAALLTLDEKIESAVSKVEFARNTALAQLETEVSGSGNTLISGGTLVSIVAVLGILAVLAWGRWLLAKRNRRRNGRGEGM